MIAYTCPVASNLPTKSLVITNEHLYVLVKYHSLTKEGPLWNVRPPPSLASIGLKLVWKSSHLAQALQIGNSHCLARLRLWWDWFTHTTSCKHDVTHYLHCFASQYWCLQCRPTPPFEPNVRCAAHGPFLQDYGIYHRTGFDCTV